MTRMMPRMRPSVFKPRDRWPGIPVGDRRQPVGDRRGHVAPTNHLATSSDCIRLQAPRLAEREGFEPSVLFRYSRFPGVRLKPLSHLSTALIPTCYDWNAVSKLTIGCCDMIPPA